MNVRGTQPHVFKFAAGAGEVDGDGLIGLLGQLEHGEQCAVVEVRVHGVTEVAQQNGIRGTPVRPVDADRDRVPSSPGRHRGQHAGGELRPPEGTTACIYVRQVASHVGDRVVFLDDEPALDLPEGTLATVTDVRGSDAIEFQIADGRVFTTMESSLGPAPSRNNSQAQTPKPPGSTTLRRSIQA